MAAEDDSTNVKLSELGEHALIGRLSALCASTLPQGVVGIGDDCAVLAQPDGTSLLLTTDLMVEHRHFEWSFTPAFDLGWKALAVSVSDVASCGGAPWAALMTLQTRSSLETSIVEEIYRGAAACAKRFAFGIVGGDTVRAEELAIGTTILGRATRPVLRSGALPGDDLWVSGEIGQAGLALAVLSGGLDAGLLADRGRAAMVRYTRPEPRVELGARLAGVATAMLDVSDGLLQDVEHIATRSRVRIVLELSHVPIGNCPNDWTVLHAVTAGDDYELALTAPAARRAELESLGALRRIGRVEDGECGLFIEDRGRALPARELLTAAGLPLGHDHFLRRPAEDSH